MKTQEQASNTIKPQENLFHQVVKDNKKFPKHPQNTGTSSRNELQEPILRKALHILSFTHVAATGPAEKLARPIQQEL